jgi:hypothetical protein
MSQLFIVTTPQNSGLGTPLATAFNYTNSNFSQLFARFQTAVPASLVGQTGDVAGMYAADSTYFYYCFADYDGSSTIWAQVTQVGNVSVNKIINGTSNVDIAAPNNPITVTVGGISNIAVFTSNGVGVLGVVSATGNVIGSYILGNGSQLTGLPTTYTDANVVTLLSSFGSNAISTTGNITSAYVIGNGSLLTTITAANITGTVANATYAVTADTAGTVTTAAQPNITSVGTLTSVSVSGNVTGGNVNTTGVVSASGNIITAGYIIGDIIGNIVANITNIPGPGGAVVFNDGLGNVAATAGLVFNSSGPNVLTVLGSYSATANVVANVVTANFIAGALTTAAQPNVTSVGTLTSLSASGNVTGGNLITTGLVSAVNITANNLVTANTVINNNISTAGNVTAANHFGTIATASQPNITAVGTLISLSVSGSVQGGNLRTAGVVSATGNITAAGNIRGGNLTVVTDIATGGNVSAASFTGIAISVIGNVTGANLLSAGAVSVTGNVTGNYFIGNGSQLTGIGTYNDSNVITLLSNLGTNSISTLGNVTAASVVGALITGVSVNVSGNVAGASLIGQIATASQTAITEVGTLTSLSVSGNINGSNIIATNINGSTLSASGNVTGASLVGTIATASQPTITDVGILTGLIVNGNITGSNLSVNTGIITVGSIVNANANAVGNIGSSTGYFNTVFAKATSAQYADLAENYVADTHYDPGTVVIFGGDAEVTISTESADERVAGVVSRNPAHLMNAGTQGLAIALRGRVDVKVSGPVIKGDSLISSNTPGVAVSIGRDRSYGQAVFAKSIETNLSDGIKIITAVIL